MTTIGTEIDNVEATVARSDLIQLCKDVAEDNVSLIALEIATNNVVGFVFNKIQVSSLRNSWHKIYYIKLI